jgi:hypothetical protein
VNGPLVPLRRDRVGTVGDFRVLADGSDIASASTMTDPSSMANGGTLAARPASKPADDDLTPDQQAQIAAQHAAFDFEASENAELQREHDMLQALLMEELKNEDEIVKKWITLI